MNAKKFHYQYNINNEILYLWSYSKNFNNLSEKEIDSDAIKFSLLILYTRIRFVESLLHLSYKLLVKK